MFIKNLKIKKQRSLKMEKSKLPPKPLFIAGGILFFVVLIVFFNSSPSSTSVPANKTFPSQFSEEILKIDQTQEQISLGLKSLHKWVYFLAFIAFLNLFALIFLAFWFLFKKRNEGKNTFKILKPEKTTDSEKSTKKTKTKTKEEK